jgi:hypothetical protein
MGPQEPTARASSSSRWEGVPLLHTVQPAPALARRIRIVSGLFAGLGLVGLLILPAHLFVQALAYGACGAVLFLGMPQLLLRRDGRLHLGKVLLWSGLLLLFGVLTTGLQ